MSVTDPRADELRPLWVFGYGSLVWDPGFPVAEAVPARLTGWHRAFCMRSIHHRGTAEDPGLVLALDAADNAHCDGAHCDGVALCVVDGAEPATLAGLRERELISSAYRERLFPVALQDGRTATALCYVIARDHPQYCGGLTLEEQAQIIAVAQGGRGPNRDYLWNTAAHLQELGLADPDLDWLSDRVRALTAQA